MIKFLKPIFLTVSKLKHSSPVKLFNLNFLLVPLFMKLLFPTKKIIICVFGVAAASAGLRSGGHWWEVRRAESRQPGSIGHTAPVPHHLYSLAISTFIILNGRKLVLVESSRSIVVKWLPTYTCIGLQNLSVWFLLAFLEKSPCETGLHYTRHLKRPITPEWNGFPDNDLE